MNVQKQSGECFITRFMAVPERFMADYRLLWPQKVTNGRKRSWNVQEPSSRDAVTPWNE
jgi:hypothetical protein